MKKDEKDKDNRKKKRKEKKKTVRKIDLLSSEHEIIRLQIGVNYSSFMQTFQSVERLAQELANLVEIRLIDTEIESLIMEERVIKEFKNKTQMPSEHKVVYQFNNVLRAFRLVQLNPMEKERKKKGKKK
jgi:hypothetical protein